MNEFDEAITRTGVFLKGAGRFREAIERRWERAQRSAHLINELAEKRMAEHDLRARLARERGYDPRTGFPIIEGGAVGLAHSISTVAFAMTTGAKTILTAIAPAGHGLALVHFDVSFDGVTSSAVPATVDVVNSTQGAAGTSAGSAVITQVRGKTTSGSAPTAGNNYTGEPTTLVALRKLYVPQLMGTYTYDFPLGREFECDSSGGTIKALGLRGNVSANVNALANLEVEAV